MSVLVDDGLLLGRHGDIINRQLVGDEGTSNSNQKGVIDMTRDGALLDVNTVAVEVSRELANAIMVKGGEGKMITASHVAWMLKQQGFSSPHTMAIRGLDRLIRCKYVRYFNTPNSNRVFGLTKLGWERWKHFTSFDEETVVKTAVVTDNTPPWEEEKLTDEEIWNELQGKIRCEHCGKYFNKRGIGRHRTTCKAKSTKSA